LVGVRIEGRLGNQLFQNAFIVAVSKKLNTGFFIDQYTERSVLEKYFKDIKGKSHGTIPLLFNINGFKNIFNFHLRRAYYKYLIWVNKFSSLEYNYGSASNEITTQNNTIYKGYFQSVSFFSGFEELIRNTFILKKPFVDQFKDKYDSLYQNNNIVTVHIRRTDYQNLPNLNLGGDDLTLPLEYYKKAIAKYNGQNVHFVFISDDLDFVSQNFKEISNKTISTDTEIMDFQHLLNADSCIIANSTFSWWGAWLNNKPGKIIYAPRYFMGWHIKKETPAEIYPHEWVQIDF
jgi:hypothetical protein